MLSTMRECTAELFLLLTLRESDRTSKESQLVPDKMPLVPLACQTLLVAEVVQAIAKILICHA
ncbi:MAG: hypothetical protein AB3A66_14285 [Nodularia sp. CChRGM 3473]